MLLLLEVHIFIWLIRLNYINNNKLNFVSCIYKGMNLNKSFSVEIIKKVY